VYGAQVSKQTITTITDRIIDGMAEWQSRPLDPVYLVLFIDAVNVKIRDGNVANRPIYIALGVTVDGTRDILGLWAGEHGDGGAKLPLRLKKDWPAIAKDLKPIYTAPSESGALDAFVAFTEQWGSRYPAIIKVWEKIIKVWEKVWPDFVPFLQFDNSIRMVVCTTNAIESINSRIRRAVNARGHFLPSRPRSNACIWRS
jgi:putative transposase